jgi:hypothetical protein
VRSPLEGYYTEPAVSMYRIERRRLEVVVSPPFSPAAMSALYAAAQTDPRLPHRLVLLIDTRALNLDFTLGDVVRRMRSVVGIFGGRLRALAHVRAHGERTPEPDPPAGRRGGEAPSLRLPQY